MQKIGGAKEKDSRKRKKKGLLAAIGAWEDFEDLEKTVASIYERRKTSKRNAGEF